MEQVRARTRMIRGDGHEKEFILDDPVTLRSTWKGNLLMLIVALVLFLAVAS